jgi:hypothetical protein
MKHLTLFENFLAESLLSSVNIDSILTPEFVEDMAAKDEFFMDMYKHEEGLTDVEDEDINQEDFLNWLEYDLRYKLEELVRHYRSEVIHNGKAIIWRAMTVTSSWLDHLEREGKHLGIYWTWDPDAADTHWGDYSKTSKVLIEAEVPENGVDWEKTLIMNIEPFTGDDEKEITLFKGVPLKILSVEIDGVLQNISKIEEKTFYS